jgi:hypothetical protein
MKKTMSKDSSKMKKGGPVKKTPPKMKMGGSMKKGGKKC